MTRDDGRPQEPQAPTGTGGPAADGPLIDPRDPLGLGDLPPLDDVGTPLEPVVPQGRDVPDTGSGASSSAPSGSPEAGGRSDPPERDAAGDVAPPDVPLPEDAGAAAGSDDPTVAAAPVEAGPGQIEPHGEPDVARTEATQGVAEPDDAAGPDASQHPDDDGASSGAPHVGTAAPGADGAPRGGLVRPARSGWARLGHAMRPRTTQGQLITAGLCALLGFALVVQVRQTTDTQLGALRQNDLVRLLDETTTRTDELERESLDLQRERDELVSGSDRQQAALDAARRNAAMQGILTGRLPATGPGVRITLTEPDDALRPATMVHVLEELRNAGAEAMELNGHRIVASSAFTGSRGAVELDGALLQQPYRWTVIGDPDTIAPALEIPGGALARVRADGGRGAVEKLDRVDVTAVRDLPDPVHASPAPDPG